MKTPYPDGAFNAHWFNFFNAISFQVMMGAPIILYAKSLNASSTVIGIIAAFAPLMVVFQLPAARFLDRFGYREFVLMGWSARTVLIFLVAVLPLIFFFDQQTKMAVLLATLFVFNLLRGISTAAWMPWIAALIPESIRGIFLSREQIFVHLGCLLSLGLSSILLAGSVDDWEYSLVFLVSAIAATISLTFIRRIPEVASQEVTRRSSTPVPWRAIIGYRPFRRLLIFNVMFLAVTGGLGVFTIEFLRDTVGLDASTILLLSGFSLIGALAALPFCGGIVDRSGSRPIMRVALWLYWLVIAGWTLTAGRVLPGTFPTIAILNLVLGIASAGFNLGNLRTIMATMPEMGRNHFFALFSVITSFGLGGAPIVWGMTLDIIGSFEAVTGAFVWQRHSIYFSVLLVFSAILLVFISRLVETSPDEAPAPTLVFGNLKRSMRHWFR